MQAIPVLSQIPAPPTPPSFPSPIIAGEAPQSIVRSVSREELGALRARIDELAGQLRAASERRNSLANRMPGLMPERREPLGIGAGQAEPIPLRQREEIPVARART